MTITHHIKVNNNNKQNNQKHQEKNIHRMDSKLEKLIH